MKKLIILIVIIILSQNLYSQQWAKTYTGSEGTSTSFYNTIYNTVCDSQGNTYIVGTFGVNAEIDGIPLLDAPLYNNAASLLIAKLDPNGNMLWRKAIKNWSNYSVRPTNNLKIVGDTSIVLLAMDMSTAGYNQYYYLYYLDTLIQGSQPFPEYPFNGGYRGSTLITFDLDGNLINNHFLQRVLLDSNNHEVHRNPLIDIQGTFDIDKDGYIYIYTRTLALYATSTSPFNIADSLKIIVDLEREFTFNIPSVENLTLFKFSPNFEDMVWCRSIRNNTVSYGGDSMNFMPYARGIDIDSSGNIYITGFLNVARNIHREGYGDSNCYSEVIVSPDNPNHKIKIAPTDAFTGFIIKYNSDGEVLWTNQMYGKSQDIISTAPACDISNVVASEENNAVYFLGVGGFLSPFYDGGSLYFEDSIPLRKYHDSTKTVLFFAKLDMETGKYISHGIAPSAYATCDNYNYFVTNPSFAVKNNQVFAQTVYEGHLKGNDTNYYGNGFALMRWKDNGYIIDVKNYPSTPNWRYAGIKNTLVNDNGEMILTGMFSNNIQFGNIQLIGGSNSNAYIVKYSSDSSFLVPFEGGDTLNDQKPISSFINEIAVTNNQLIIYPNPTKDDIYIISTNERINSYSILNTNGQRIINKENIKANKEKINLTNIPKGMYIIKIITDNNVYSRKVIKT